MRLILYSYMRHLFYERRLGNMIVALSSNTPGQVVQVLPVSRLYKILKKKAANEFPITAMNPEHTS